MSRNDDRKENQLRTVEIKKDYISQAEGSVLITLGNTKVICTASVENGVPPWLEGKNKGWVTAEYAMIPCSTETRVRRERGTRIGGRTQEIQRLIGRSLRCVVDLGKIPENTIIVDNDVISADGGTRTAAITGSFVALHLAFEKMVEKGDLKEIPINNYLAATSVGLVNNELLLDLNYKEDSGAQVDMNVAMTSDGNFVEVQATGEQKSFSGIELENLLSMSEKGIRELFEIQKKAIE